MSTREAVEPIVLNETVEKIEGIEDAIALNLIGVVLIETGTYEPKQLTPMEFEQNYKRLDKFPVTFPASGRLFLDCCGGGLCYIVLNDDPDVRNCYGCEDFEEFFKCNYSFVSGVAEDKKNIINDREILAYILDIEDFTNFIKYEVYDKFSYDNNFRIVKQFEMNTLLNWYLTYRHIDVLRIPIDFTITIDCIEFRTNIFSEKNNTQTCIKWNWNSPKNPKFAYIYKNSEIIDKYSY